MHFGGPLLLDGIDLKIEAGRRIGIIGRNGCGKSTLLKLLLGELEPTKGTIARQGGTRIGYQAQELTFAPGETVREAMEAAFTAQREREQTLRTLEGDLATTTDDRTREQLLREYQTLQEEQERDGVYDVEFRIQRMLQRLGLDASTWDKPLSSFSGGERNIIGLARVLLEQPDVLLLDEPTNHLDMDGLEWFIDFVRKSKTSIVLVSHDRHMLDAVATEIWELRNGRITQWTGNYSDYQRQKAEADALQERQFRVQQRLIKRLEFQARRLRDMAAAYDDPGQAKRAKAMLKRVERMDKVERPNAEGARFHASLSGAPRHGRIALQINDYAKAFDERVLFDGANLEIEFGERVCLVGPNGSGKTTLFRDILGQGSWENTTLRLGRSTRVGEYKQFHEEFDARVTLEDWLMNETGLDAPGARKLLHRFLFTREDLERPVATLSGGEKSRLQLARLVHAQVNFLLLDEPTNHLDVEACEQLEEMLQEFEGTLLLISHDRYFLDKLVTRVVEVQDKQLADHPLSFAEWFQARRAAGQAGRTTALVDRQVAQTDKDAARAAHDERARQKREQNRLRNRHRDVEASIETLEARAQQLEKDIEGAYAPGSDRSRAEALLAEQKQVRANLEAAYTEWEQLEEALAAFSEE